MTNSPLLPDECDRALIMDIIAVDIGDLELIDIYAWLLHHASVAAIPLKVKVGGLKHFFTPAVEYLNTHI